MTLSSTYRRLGRCLALGLAAFALAAPVAAGMPLNTGQAPTDAVVRPDDRPGQRGPGAAVPAQLGGHPSSVTDGLGRPLDPSAWRADDTAVRPDDRPVRPGTPAPAPVETPQQVAEPTTDWRNVAIGLSAALALLLAALLGVGIVARRHRHTAQLS